MLVLFCRHSVNYSKFKLHIYSSFKHDKIYLMKLLKYTLIPFIAFVIIYPTKAFSKANDTNEKINVIISFNNKPGTSEQSLVRNAGGKVKRFFHLVPAISAEIPLKTYETLLKNPLVKQITLDTQVQAVDIELDNSWGVKHINTEPVHTAGFNAQGVKVGIIDSGVNYNHPDLNNNYAGGYDFVENDNEPMDVYGHGTHVAGTACGENNNNGLVDPKLGVIGVAPACSLYSLRVLDENGAGPWSSIIAAVEWAVDNNLQIINLSLGHSQDPGPIVEQAFSNAEAAGLYIVAAAGNSGNSAGKGNTVIYPAKYASVVAVSAVDSNNNRPRWSSTGEEVELAAPGVSVYSTWNDTSSYADPQPQCELDSNNEYGCYKYGSGTSMAAPHVAGVAALLISKGVTDTSNNGKINDELRTILNSTAIDIGSLGFDTHYGYGLVDAWQAINYNSIPQPPEQITLNAVGYKIKGLQKADLIWQGAASEFVNIYRDNLVIATVPDSEFYTDNIDLRGPAQHRYQVCELGSVTSCSNEVTITF